MDLDFINHPVVTSAFVSHLVQNDAGEKLAGLEESLKSIKTTVGKLPSKEEVAKIGKEANQAHLSAASAVKEASKRPLMKEVRDYCDGAYQKK